MIPKDLVPELKWKDAFCLTGMHREISIAENHTVTLWKQFMPRKREISSLLSEALYSVQIYPAHFDFANPDLRMPFTKWVAVETPCHFTAPDQMEVLKVPAGQYAVFLHKGTPDTYISTINFIFNKWLPDSSYVYDFRPQFERMDHRYRHNDPDSIEEVWIPVRLKAS